MQKGPFGAVQQPGWGSGGTFTPCWGSWCTADEQGQLGALWAGSDPCWTSLHLVIHTGLKEITICCLIYSVQCQKLHYPIIWALLFLSQGICTNEVVLVWQFSPVLFRGCSNALTKYRNKDQQLMLEPCSEPTFYNPGNIVLLYGAPFRKASQTRAWAEKEMLR